jgi:hypothetical protein
MEDIFQVVVEVVLLILQEHKVNLVQVVVE